MLDEECLGYLSDYQLLKSTCVLQSYLPLHVRQISFPLARYEHVYISHSEGLGCFLVHLTIIFNCLVYKEVPYKKLTSFALTLCPLKNSREV